MGEWSHAPILASPNPIVTFGKSVCETVLGTNVLEPLRTLVVAGDHLEFDQLRDPSKPASLGQAEPSGSPVGANDNSVGVIKQNNKTDPDSVQPWMMIHRSL